MDGFSEWKIEIVTLRIIDRNLRSFGYVSMLVPGILLLTGSHQKRRFLPELLFLRSLPRIQHFKGKGKIPLDCR